jgi:hypothetical protein
MTAGHIWRRFRWGSTTYSSQPPAFTPIAAKVIVKEGQKAVLNAKLDVDLLVSKAIGGMEVEGVR